MKTALEALAWTFKMNNSKDYILQKVNTWGNEVFLETLNYEALKQYAGGTYILSAEVYHDN